MRMPVRCVQQAMQAAQPRTKRTRRWMLALALRRLLRDKDGNGLATAPPNLPAQAGAAPAAPACPGMAVKRQLCAPRAGRHM